VQVPDVNRADIQSIAEVSKTTEVISIKEFKGMLIRVVEMLRVGANASVVVFSQHMTDRICLKKISQCYIFLPAYGIEVAAELVATSCQGCYGKY